MESGKRRVKKKKKTLIMESPQQPRPNAFNFETVLWMLAFQFQTGRISYSYMKTQGTNVTTYR